MLIRAGALKQSPKSIKAANLSDSIDVALLVDGVKQSFTAARTLSILEAALAHGIDAPYSCKAGVCSTCKCKIIEGEIEMRANHALEDYEIAQGYALSCQTYALSDKIVAEYEY